MEPEESIIKLFIKEVYRIKIYRLLFLWSFIKNSKKEKNLFLVKSTKKYYQSLMDTVNNKTIKINLNLNNQSH